MGAITRNFANNILGTGQLDATDGVDGNIPAPNVNNESLDNITALPSSVGFGIKTVSSDPPSLNEGEIFFNSTDGVFKSLVNVEAWSSGASLSTARHSLGGAGSQTAGLAFGGPSANNATEEYNGSGWASGGNLNTGRSNITGTGTLTAGLGFGGYTTAPNTQGQALTEEYDGSSWTAGGALSLSRYNPGGFGIQTAAAACGGYNNSQPLGNVVVNTEEYNGTSWTAGGNLGTARYEFGACGTQTAGVAFGGYDYNHGPAPSPLRTGETEEYDGTSWTRVNSMNDARGQTRGSGSQTEALCFGGFLTGPGPTTNKTEKYDGTTWSVSPATLGTARHRHGESSTSGTAALAFGGQTPPTTGVTEEYNLSTFTTTAAAWASGGAMTTARTGLASAGTQTANVFIGGQMSNSPYAPLNTVELYDGSSWSTNPNNAPYSASNNCGTGTQTAALSWGGYPNITTTLEFDGSAFTSGGSLSTGRELTSSNIGTQTAAVAAGGYVRSPDTYPTQSEEYNGTSWTAGGNLNTSGYGRSGAGTETAGLVSGGIEPGQLNATEEYNGTAWTSVNNRPYSAGNAGTSGTQTDALYYGGNPGGALTTTLGYDGTNWSTRPSMAQARAMMGSSAGGTSSAALASSGAAPTATEEFTGETSAQVAKTIQSS